MPKTKKKTQFPYKNLLLAYVIFIVVTCLSLTPLLAKFTEFIQLLGLFGVFLGGMLYVSSFTFSAGLVTLLVLAPNYNIFLMTFVASLGSLLSDYLLFRFIREDLEGEIRHLFNRLGGKYLVKVLHLRPFAWIMPVLGAIIIASPIPDELGISLLGLSKVKPLQFAVITFILDAIGIFAVVGFSDLVAVTLFK